MSSRQWELKKDKTFTERTVGLSSVTSGGNAGIVTVNIKGVKEIERDLKRLGSSKTAIKVYNNALAAGARVVRNEARKRAPGKKDFRLKKAIKVFRIKSRTNPKVILGIDTKADGAQLAHLLEFGTQERVYLTRKSHATKKQTVLKKKQFTGKIAKGSFAFIRPAYDATKSKVLKAIERKVQKQIESEAKKMGRKNAKR